MKTRIRVFQKLNREKKMNNYINLNRILVVALCLMIFASPLLAAETVLEQPIAESGKATIVFDASPLTAMKEIPFAISLLDVDGKAITDAELMISMDMPAMPMPPNNPAATWENGAYRGTAIFTMAGGWQVKVNIQAPGLEQQVVFDIEQVMM